MSSSLQRPELGSTYFGGGKTLSLYCYFWVTFFHHNISVLFQTLWKGGRVDKSPFFPPINVFLHLLYLFLVYIKLCVCVYLLFPPPNHLKVSCIRPALDHLILQCIFPKNKDFLFNTHGMLGTQHMTQRASSGNLTLVQSCFVCCGVTTFCNLRVSSSYTILYDFDFFVSWKEI